MQNLPLSSPSGGHHPHVIAATPTRATKKRQPRTMPIRFRHPEHPAWVWSGQGSWPLWVRAWQAAHGSLTGISVTPFYLQEKK